MGLYIDTSIVSFIANVRIFQRMFASVEYELMHNKDLVFVKNCRWNNVFWWFIERVFFFQKLWLDNFSSLSITVNECGHRNLLLSFPSQWWDFLREREKRYGASFDYNDFSTNLITSWREVSKNLFHALNIENKEDNLSDFNNNFLKEIYFCCFTSEKFFAKIDRR